MKMILLVLVALALSGCASYTAEEVHHTISFPGVSDSIHALGIKKTVDSKGRVVRKADTLTHETSILGFSRSATYKGAEVKVEKKKEDDQ